MRISISRITVLAVAAISIFGIIRPSTVTAEPEVVCSWCVTVSDMLGNTAHHFPDPSNRCVSPNPGGGVCQRCGGSSTCHGLGGPESDGACNHHACGGENLAKVEEELSAAFEAGDQAKLSLILAAHHENVTILVNAAGGRIELIANCQPTQVASTFALPISLRDGPALVRTC